VRAGADDAEKEPPKKKKVKGKRRKGHAAHDDPDSDDDTNTPANDTSTAENPLALALVPGLNTESQAVTAAGETTEGALTNGDALGKSRRSYAAVKESQYPMPNFAGMNLVTEEEYARLEKEASTELVSLQEAYKSREEGLGKRKDRKKYKTATDVYECVAERRESEADELDNMRWRGYGIPHAAETAAVRERRRRPTGRVVAGQDVLIFVSMHNPANPEQVLEELVVLGTTTLEEWKDAVECRSDLQAAEIGLPPKRDGYLFIEGVFYNDMRGLPAPPSGLADPVIVEKPEGAVETGGTAATSGGAGRGGGGRGGGLRDDPSVDDANGEAAANAEAEIDDPEDETKYPIGKWPNLRPFKTQTQWPYKGPYPHPKPPVPHPRWTEPIPAIDYSTKIVELQKTNDDAAEKAGGNSPEDYMSCPGMRDHALDAFTAARTETLEAELAKGTEDAEARQIALDAGEKALIAARKTRPPAFVSKSMAMVTFNDLDVVIGKPYLYSHMEEPHCEHPVVIRDVRLAHPDDPVDRADYPARLFVGRKYRRKCQMCDVFEARHVTHSDRHAPCHPCFFCDQCMNCLHLGQDGEPWYSEYTHNFYHHE
jgi:snRNA-activating protein complex subunit 3